MPAFFFHHALLLADHDVCDSAHAFLGVHRRLMQQIQYYSNRRISQAIPRDSRNPGSRSSASRLVQRSRFAGDSSD